MRNEWRAAHNDLENRNAASEQMMPTGSDHGACTLAIARGADEGVRPYTKIEICSLFASWHGWSASCTRRFLRSG